MEPDKPLHQTSASDEIFERLGADGLVTMALQAGQVEREKQMVLNMAGHCPLHAGSSSSGGVGPASANDEPYVLLDVRPPEAFRRNHIKGAQSYPHTMLSRNYEPAHVLSLKNRPGRLIVCYDEAEKHAPKVATTLLQRNYNNVVVLRGGLKAAHAAYPDGLIVGEAAEPSSDGGANGAGADAPIPHVDEVFSEEDVATLRAQLKHNLLPAIAKSRLMKETELGRIRKAMAADAKQQQKAGIRKPPPAANSNSNSNNNAKAAGRKAWK